MNMSNQLIGRMEINRKERERIALLTKQFLEQGGKIYYAEIGERANYKPESPRNAAKEGKAVCEDKKQAKTLAEIVDKHVGK